MEDPDVGGGESLCELFDDDNMLNEVVINDVDASLKGFLGVSVFGFDACGLWFSHEGSLHQGFERSSVRAGRRDFTSAISAAD